MELIKEQLDYILDQTDSKPEQLLEWFRKCYKVRSSFCDIMFPCIYRPYLDKYSFYPPTPTHCSGISVIIPTFIDSQAHRISIFAVWNHALESRSNYLDLVKQFKKLYNLK